MTARDPWPPRDERSMHLSRLAAFIESGGAAHFLDAPLALATVRDFPAPWQPTATAVEQVLVRLLWLAHVDLDVALDDQRRFEAVPEERLHSDVRWLATVDGVACFQIDAVGADHGAGPLCQEIGRAYAAWHASAAAYRDAPPPAPSPVEGAIAAIYLSLGAVATSAHPGGRGGLGLVDAIYLLAIQAVLRGAAPEAYGPVREAVPGHFADSVAALTPHRDEIAAYLGLDLAAQRAALTRAPAPRPVVERPEPPHRHRYADLRTYRMRTSNVGAGVVVGATAGLSLGSFALAAGLAIPVVGAAVAVPLAVGVWLWRRRHDVCARCGHKLPAAAARCPGCGATNAGRVDSLTAMQLAGMEPVDPPSSDPP